MKITIDTENEADVQQGLALLLKLGKDPRAKPDESEHRPGSMGEIRAKVADLCNELSGIITSTHGMHLLDLRNYINGPLVGSISDEMHWQHASYVLADYYSSRERLPRADTTEFNFNEAKNRAERVPSDQTARSPFVSEDCIPEPKMPPDGREILEGSGNVTDHVDDLKTPPGGLE